MKFSGKPRQLIILGAGDGAAGSEQQITALAEREVS